MLTMKCLILFYLLTLILHCSAEWCYQAQANYDDQCKGPELWKEVNAQCGNTRQSPVNIATKKTVVDGRLTPFNFTGYKNIFNGTIRNIGHSVVVDVAQNIMATVSRGFLGDTYKPIQFHFHWGTDVGAGSEHTIDGEQYPMELHIVHIKQRYNIIADALNDPSGIAALRFFFEESNSTNTNYDQLIQALRSIQYTKNITTIRNISISQFILSEDKMTKYYRYNGSLTTPNCSEAVVWTVFKNPIPLSREQLRAFPSQLKFSDGNPMVGVFRPVQPRNGRLVYRSSGQVVLASALLLFTSIITAFSLSHLN
ncbi:carbonic anhydrase 4-like [Misgurnus anguillicaudatus]|uniref:carbonic anhydrase 4-like n=1 Tax=Misgurnus anguillicaudatus TaxID=75329 RepID=UPI003CCFB229